MDEEEYVPAYEDIDMERFNYLINDLGLCPVDAELILTPMSLLSDDAKRAAFAAFDKKTEAIRRKNKEWEKNNPKPSYKDVLK